MTKKFAAEKFWAALGHVAYIFDIAYTCALWKLELTFLVIHFSHVNDIEAGNSVSVTFFRGKPYTKAIRWRLSTFWNDCMCYKWSGYIYNFPESSCFSNEKIRNSWISSRVTHSIILWTIQHKFSNYYNTSRLL